MVCAKIAEEVKKNLDGNVHNVHDLEKKIEYLHLKLLEQQKILKNVHNKEDKNVPFTVSSNIITNTIVKETKPPVTKVEQNQFSMVNKNKYNNYKHGNNIKLVKFCE